MSTELAILVVEDVEPVRRMMIRLLHHAGFPNVVAAASGEEALQLVAGGQRLDLLVTDLRLPGINGAELVRTLRGALPDLKVLVMSALADVDLEQAMAGLEGALLLQKPFLPGELERKVHEALGQKRVKRDETG